VRDKGHVIYNGVDLRRFANKARHAHARRYILALGRLTHNKGFDILLQAFAEARAADAKVDLIIAGEGEQRDHLQSLLNELGLAEHVHLFGAASAEKVVELLNGAVFVVVPSRHEAFGIVALEALAAGKHVLATRTDGLAEFLSNVSEKSVTLVEPGTQQLAYALKNRLALNGNGSAIAPETPALLDQYSWTNVAGRYESALMGSSQS
jgi:glycogen(starch) synthase